VLSVLHILPVGTEAHDNEIWVHCSHHNAGARRYFAPDLQRPGQYATMVLPPPSSNAVLSLCT
jgi:hypothetical protein